MMFNFSTSQTEIKFERPCVAPVSILTCSCAGLCSYSTLLLFTPLQPPIGSAGINPDTNAHWLLLFIFLPLCSSRTISCDKAAGGARTATRARPSHRHGLLPRRSCHTSPSVPLTETDSSSQNCPVSLSVWSDCALSASAQAETQPKAQCVALSAAWQLLGTEKRESILRGFTT